MTGRIRSLPVVVAAGLVLADASVVVLALPPLLRELDTTIAGVAAVVAVYTAVLAIALPLAAWIQRRAPLAVVGATGFGIFGLASLGCGVAQTLTVLLALRVAQAIGGALALVAAFALLDAGAPGGRRRWSALAVVGAALGPALGGALTELADWRAIFLAQAPIALLAAVAALTSRPATAAQRADTTSAHPPPPPTISEPGGVPGLAARGSLALVSAALSAVLFLLVLLLVVGWGMTPLGAAAALTALPLSAAISGRIPGPPVARAAIGAGLVAGGVLALRWLPDAVWWATLAPQAAAGAGLGLAIPALAGELLPERTPTEAAHVLAIRHAGIAVALIALAPILTADLETGTRNAQVQGVAVLLDAPLPPRAKIELAPGLFAAVDEQSPRDGLRRAAAKARERFDGRDRVVFDRTTTRFDDVLVEAVRRAFERAFLFSGLLALLAVPLLLLARVPGSRTGVAIGSVVAAAAIALGLPTAAAAAHARWAPEPVRILDPCKGRDVDGGGGIDGKLQELALKALDSAACKLGSSREELVLAFGSEQEAKRFQRRHGINPRDRGDILDFLLDQVF